MFAVKLVAKGVTGAYGLTKEAMADREAKKSTNHQARLNVPAHGKEEELSDTSSMSSDDEGVAQELDEVQQKVAPQHKDSQLEKAQNLDQVLENFMQKHPPPKYSPVAGKLEMPVILPQRRPKSKERGFVRAYAPMLQTCGIEQQDFLDFLDGFGKAIQVRPIYAIHNIKLTVVPSPAPSTLPCLQSCMCRRRPC
jgi:hypothetical protein